LKCETGTKRETRTFNGVDDETGRIAETLNAVSKFLTEVLDELQ
jgi:hypothetical protein